MIPFDEMRNVITKELQILHPMDWIISRVIFPDTGLLEIRDRARQGQILETPPTLFVFSIKAPFQRLHYKYFWF